MRLRASLAAVLLTTGCSTTYAIPKSELTRLDGWKDDSASRLADVGGLLVGQPRDTRLLRDEQGQQHPFSVDTPLVLQRSDGESLAHRYVQVKVDALRFEGVPFERPDSPVVVPLDEVKTAGMRRFSLGRTLLLAGGIGVGVLASVIVAGMVIDPRDGNAGGDSGSGIPCGHGCTF